MNHREEPLTSRNKKKAIKEARTAQYMNKALVDAQPTIRNLRGQNPAKPPLKNSKKIRGNVLEIKKSFERKKLANAQPMKPSKRTNPGKIPPHTSTPKSTRREGARWISAVEKQTLIRTRTLNRKLSRKK